MTGSGCSRWHRPAVVAVVLVALAVLSSCGDGERASAVSTSSVSATSTTRSVSGTTAVRESALVARATGTSIDVFGAPGAAQPVRTLESRSAHGGPLVFLVRSVKGDWLDVYLPVRPNGTTGWIRTTDVTVARTEYRVEVALGEHRLRVWHRGELEIDTPAGVGTQHTPTPGGVFYLTELLRPPDPAGPYGPYAFGISGYSEALEEFRGGAGFVGIHGTNDPDSVGHDVSHGCVRVGNDVITELASMLPLGTPVEIRV
jgi:lipoprotein-anchoring transpeptidase ErfK/SrfK